MRVVALALAAVSWGAAAEQVTVLTSFPKEISEAYKKAFEKKFPGATLEVLNKGTTAGIAYLRELPPGQRPDVFWASAPDAFEVLAAEKLLAKAPEVSNREIPAKIGFYPVNDPEGLYYGQAISGYGIMWNTRYLKARRLPEPKEWADLAKPVYFGHVAMSSPARSGTTHLTVETILQGEGWERGWAQLLAIAGNSAAITERSFGVPDGVNNGQFGIGLVANGRNPEGGKRLISPARARRGEASGVFTRGHGRPGGRPGVARALRAARKGPGSAAEARRARGKLDRAGARELRPRALRRPIGAPPSIDVGRTLQ